MSQKKVVLSSFYITNYKGIGELSAEVNGNHILIVGHNGAGKTSVMETIRRSALRIDPKEMADLPIKLGASKAEAGMTYLVDENGKEVRYLIKTIVRPSGVEMDVIDIDNNLPQKPPAKRIKEILGESVDLTHLIDLKGKDQVQEIFRALGGSEIFDNLQAKLKTLASQVTTINTRIKDAKSSLDKVDVSHQDLMDYRSKGWYGEKKVLPQKSASKLLEIERKRQAAERNNENRQKAVEKIEVNDSEILSLQKRIQELKDKNEEIRHWLESNPAVDIAVFDEEIESAQAEEESYNKEVQGVMSWNEKVDKISRYQEETKKLESLESEKQGYQKEQVETKDLVKTSIADLKLNEIVPELDLKIEEGEEGLYYGELPFNRRQISYGKCIVAIAKLSSYINAGKFNFIHIPDWESLDKNSRKEILDFAKKNPELNIQFGIEEVSDTILGVKIITNEEAK